MNSSHLLRSLVCGALLAVASAPSVSAEGSFDIPPGAHFNPQKLAHAGDFLRDQVAQGKIPGAILLIQQHGKPVYHEFFGVQDVVSKAPMTDQTIFRLFSMTKAITSVAAMTLVDEGKLKLEDPVAKYIPSFANVQVGVEKKSEDGTKTLDLVPPNRPPTILDLMRHSSGITYGFYGDSLVRKAYAAANLYAGDFDLAEFAERIAKLPLHDQPGSLWQYGHSTDVLARIMEIVSGKSLLEVEREKLLDPLGMKDTGYYITDPVKQSRIAEPFPNERTIGIDAQFGDPRVPGKWESGGGGLLSTAADYARFLQMLLNGGAVEGKRFLSPKTVAFMTSDHDGDGIVPGPYYLPGPGYGFGLGFAVRRTAGVAPDEGSVGDYTWNGVGGTHFWVDPKEDMFVLFLIQSPRQRQHYMTVMRNMVYGAMEK